MTEDDLAREGDGRRITRATLLKGASGLVGAGAVAQFLAACGGGGSASGAAAKATTSAASGPVQRGGQLVVAYPGAGTAETVNPLRGVSPIDQARIQQLFDPLVLVNADLSTSPGLALDWIPNRSATSWDVKLRPGVTFHNGKEFGPADVIYSIRMMGGKTSNALPFVSEIDLHGLKALGKHTVRIPLRFPDANLAQNFVLYNTWIFQDGETNFARPVGTGPFKFTSFEPGQQSVFDRNEHYWESGKPYVDSVKITSINDDTARVNALLSGQVDAVALMPYALAKAHKSSGDINVMDAHSPQALVFYMRCDTPPFNDNRVRMAMRLIADRPALVSDAISGFGTVGNDTIGKGLEFYDSSLPQRAQDLEKAKSLLKVAGAENLQVSMQISGLVPGFIESATLFAQQAGGAGVKVALRQVDPSAYFNPSLQYLKMPFAESQWPVLSLKFFYLQSLAANAPYNETHFKSASFNKLLFKAIGELDKTKAQQYWGQVQKIQYDQGGYLQWTNADFVDGLSLKVKGLQPSSAGLLGYDRFLDAWKTTV